MKKLITKKEYNEMVKYHSQIGGYAFSKTIDNISIDIECHHKHGNELRISNDDNGNFENCKFRFGDLTFEKFTEYVSELKAKVEEI